MGRPLRCRLGIHKYTVHRTPNEEPYLQCERCGKVHDRELRTIPLI